MHVIFCSYYLSNLVIILKILDINVIFFVKLFKNRVCQFLQQANMRFFGWPFSLVFLHKKWCLCDVFASSSEFLLLFWCLRDARPMPRMRNTEIVWLCFAMGFLWTAAEGFVLWFEGFCCSSALEIQARVYFEGYSNKCRKKC